MEALTVAFLITVGGVLCLVAYLYAKGYEMAVEHDRIYIVERGK